MRVDVRLDRGVAAGVKNLAADDLSDGGGRLFRQVLSLRVDGEDGDGRALAAFFVRLDLFASARPWRKWFRSSAGPSGVRAQRGARPTRRSSRDGFEGYSTDPNVRW